MSLRDLSIFAVPRRSLAVGLLAALAVSGCGSVPTVHHYVLAVPPVEAEGVVGHGPMLRLGALGIAPPYDQDRLVYRVGDEGAEVGFYEQHRWAGPPADLVAEALLEGLRRAEGLGGVEPGPWETGTLGLTGRVLWLEEVDRPSGISARVGLDLTLLGPEGARLWQRRFTAEHTGSAEDAGTVVEMLRQALAEIVAEVVGEVSASSM